MPQTGGARALDELAPIDRLPILIVDDRPENLRALEAVLDPMGYPLQSATSGEEALRLLLERDYGLILLDVRMPGMDGLETARLIKGRMRTRDTPIVFLTAARDELGDMIRGYGIGAVDYLLKPIDSELLRSKVAVFTELESSRRALKRSEAFLRAAFEAAPIGKTMLDAQLRVVRSNPAFARLLGRPPEELEGLQIAEVCHPADRVPLAELLDQVADGRGDRSAPQRAAVDIRLIDSSGAEVWVDLVASKIDPAELPDAMLLVQWVDLSARRRAEQARADLLVEQAARAQAETMADRLRRLQAFSGVIESLSLDALLPELALRVAELFDAEAAEVELTAEGSHAVTVRSAGRRFTPEDAAAERWNEVPLEIEGALIGVLRVALPEGRSLPPAERALLLDVGERAALGIARAQLHEREHQIAVELQRGLLPKELPTVCGVSLAAHYQAAGLGAEAGGDWYDAFGLPGGRVGLVVGDVTGRGIPAASAMGQLRSVTRAFALASQATPGGVLTRLNRHQLALGLHDLFTIVYAVLDPAAGTLSWANAGHPPPLLRRGSSGEIVFLEGGEGLTGLDEVTYEGQQVTVAPGDTLILYTDGLVERRGESLDDGLRRLAQAAQPYEATVDVLCAHLIEAVTAPESLLQDDVTALVARVDAG